MKALTPPRPNELDDLKEPAPHERFEPQQAPSRPPTLDTAILQAFAADSAADTRALLESAMSAYGADPTSQKDWLDAVLGVFDLS